MVGWWWLWSLNSPCFCCYSCRVVDTWCSHKIPSTWPGMGSGIYLLFSEELLQRIHITILTHLGHNHGLLLQSLPAWSFPFAKLVLILHPWLQMWQIWLLLNVVGGIRWSFWSQWTVSSLNNQVKLCQNVQFVYEGFQRQSFLWRVRERKSGPQPSAEPWCCMFTHLSLLPNSTCFASHCSLLHCAKYIFLLSKYCFLLCPFFHLFSSSSLTSKITSILST